MSYPLEKLSKHYNIAFEALKTIATSYYYNGRLENAIMVLEQAVTLCRDDAVEKEVAFEIVLQYGTYVAQQAAVQSGNFDAALEIAETLQIQAANNVETSQALNLMGSIYYQQALNGTERDFSKPRQYFEEALALLNDEATSQLKFWPTLRMGLTHQFSNEPEQALDYFHQAEAIARDNDLELELSFAVRHVGFILESQEKLDEALIAQQEALELRKRLGFKVALSNAYVAVASIYEGLEEIDKALDYYAQAVTTAREVGLARSLFLALVNYGITLQTVGQYEEAITILEEAKIHAETVGHQHGLQIIEEKLAELTEKG